LKVLKHRDLESLLFDVFFIRVSQHENLLDCISMGVKLVQYSIASRENVVAEQLDL
jgi:hypothetical protein